MSNQLVAKKTKYNDKYMNLPEARKGVRIERGDTIAHKG